MERDELFITDLASLKLGFPSEEDGEGGETLCGKESQVRRLIMTLSAFENQLKERDAQWVIQLLYNFPNLEEFVLVLGDIVSSDEAMRRDLDVVEVNEKEILKSRVIMTLCMEVFQPWRAFDHLWGVEMVESAVRRWIEDIVRKNGKFGTNWKPPKFKIWEVRPARQFRA